MLLVTLLVLITLIQVVFSAPGKAALWVAEGASSDILPSSVHLSRSLTNKDLQVTIAEYLNNIDAVILLESESILSLPYVASSIQESSSSILMPHIYQSEKETDSLKQTITNLPNFQNAIYTDLNHITDSLKSSSTTHHNQPAAYIVTLSGDNSDRNEQLLKSIQKLNKRVLYIAIEETGPLSSLPTITANYNRLLASSNSTTGNLDYLPEGSEYSIYYKGTYLYITPDIFTGLLTGLFIAFTVYIGMGCLGAIQTPSSFNSKVPPVGREA